MSLDLAICVPTYRRFHRLRLIAVRLVQLKNVREIIIISNEKNSEQRKFLENLNDPRINYIENTRNIGFAGSYSKCLSISTCRFLHIISDEDTLTEDADAAYEYALNSMLRFNAFVCAIPLKVYNGTHYPDLNSKKYKRKHRNTLIKWGHIGSAVFDTQLLDSSSINAFECYCKSNAAVYPTTALAISCSYLKIANTMKSDWAVLELGKTDSFQSISGKRIYSYEARVEQYLQLDYFLKALKLRKARIDMFWMFSRYALVDAVTKECEPIFKRVHNLYSKRLLTQIVFIMVIVNSILNLLINIKGSFLCKNQKQS